MVQAFRTITTTETVTETMVDTTDPTAHLKAEVSHTFVILWSLLSCVPQIILSFVTKKPTHTHK